MADQFVKEAVCSSDTPFLVMILCYVLQAKQSADDQKLTHLSSLCQLGVDVNQVLLAQSVRPKEVIQVVSANEAANVHLHYS